MKSRSAFVLPLLLFVCSTSDSLAQTTDVRRPALPVPPPLANTEAAGSDLRFDRGKPTDENLKALKAIEDKLIAAQEQLRTIDRKKLAPSPQGTLESLAPASRDPERVRAQREVTSWDRVRRRFALESICGPTDDTVDVELYLGNAGPTQEFVKARQVSTGQIQWNANFAPTLQPNDDAGNVIGVRWCTGTLISDRIFITAGHCFDINSNDWSTPARKVGNAFVSLTPQELAPLMHVNFNYQRDGSQCANPADPRTCPVRTADAYPILRLLEHRRGSLDYAIVELGPGADGQLPGQHYAPTAYDASSLGLAQANLLTIIQHPNGVPKRIGAGRQLRISGNSVFYSQIDTLGGSSGAGVLDQTGKVIGIHTNGGCTETGGENSGVILRAVAQVSDVVR